MSVQYTVNVTNGVASVVIPGVDATAEIASGDTLIVYGRTGVYYVASAPSYDGTDTTVPLTTPYGGASGTGLTGQFKGPGEWSANQNYPLPARGDLDPQEYIAEAIEKIDQDMAARPTSDASDVAFTGGDVAFDRVRLNALAQSLALTGAVDVFLYDTRNDSDGGAWRERCQHTSWYAELGEFPVAVLGVATASAVTLYDATDPELPVWASFTVSASTPGVMLRLGTPTAIAARDGLLIAGSASYGLIVVSFPADDYWTHRTGSQFRFGGRPISKRNDVLTHIVSGRGGSLVSDDVNHIAITVLDDAPYALPTGLPVPTIAVATEGGCSVILQSGAVVNSSTTSPIKRVAFVRDRLWYAYNSSFWRSVAVSSLAAGFAGDAYDNTTTPAFPAASTAGRALARDAVGSTAGLAVFRENPGTPASGMLAYITRTYNTGWMVGDIRGCWLADSTAETVVGSELVTNGTFDTDLSGWTDTSTGTGSATWDAGTVRLQGAGGTDRGKIQQTLATLSGKTYALAVDLLDSAYIGVTLSSATNVVGLVSGGLPSTPGTHIITFTAGSTSTTLEFTTGNALYNARLDNITCRLAVLDRSVKARPLQVFGSLTKAAVATGAGLVGFSGFSASNYLEQPYSGDLDAGTGDFCWMGWIYTAATAPAEAVYARYDGTNYYGFCYLAAGSVRAGTTGASTTFGSVPANSWSQVVVVRRNGTLYAYINGVESATTAADASNLTGSGDETFRLGRPFASHSAFSGSMALWRVSATAPSADQIKHAYQTERALFQDNAACTLAGSSDSITALAYDDTTRELHALTSYGRSTFRGLRRVGSEATAVGTPVAIAAGSGALAQAGSTHVSHAAPSRNVRSEMRPGQGNQVPETFYFSGTGSATTFTLQPGWKPKQVYVGGILKIEGSTGDYTAMFDGFRYAVVFAVAPASGTNNVQIVARRV